MPGAVAFDTFDIQSEEPWNRHRVRRAVQTDGKEGVQHSRQLDARPVDEVDVVVNFANRATLRRLSDIYARTLYGTMPMTYVHPEAGTLLVVFDDPRAVERYLSFARGSFTVRLRSIVGYG